MNQVASESNTPALTEGVKSPEKATDKTSGGANVVDSNVQGTAEAETGSEDAITVVYKLCDRNKPIISAWQEEFKAYIPDRIQVHAGDIFENGPAADAIVSPANSFGFMDGGIDMAYSQHFGWQMQERLQKQIREKYHGELLVGDAIIIPAFEGWIKENSVDMSKYNEGKPIKYLVSAPTMRVPMDVSDTVNAYLAFRAVILAVKKHNDTPGSEPIRSVLCPGLGTAVGTMSGKKCAHQMLCAFETFELGLHPDSLEPKYLEGPWCDQANLITMVAAFERFDLGIHKELLHPASLKKEITDHVILKHYGDETVGAKKKDLKEIKAKSKTNKSDPPKEKDKSATS